MSSKPKILAFAGSARKGSFNKALVRIAAEGARGAGAEVTFIDYCDFPLPVYDQDCETERGIAEQALKVKDLFKEHDGFLISSPEHNSSISALLKNVIDWVSRPAEGEASLECFTGKVAILMAASPGGLGGLRGLNSVRSILSSLGTIVLPDQIAIPEAHLAFDDNGALKDSKKQERIAALGATLVRTVGKLKA
jgi:chromate reductase, NAD(P)H dehydrogenase (quinone)